MAHYDPRGEIGPHVRRQVDALRDGVDDLLIVSTADLTDSARRWFESRARLLQRRNFGYDFFSYKVGLDTVSDLSAYDEVIICNDTYVGPLVPYSRIFSTMQSRAVDFWGLTGSKRISPHAQSFFVAFRPWLVDSKAFRKFWDEMVPISDRGKVINRYEVGMSQSLVSAGFRWSSYFSESDQERKLARRRVAWWAAHRSSTRERSSLRSWRANSREDWNPAIGLADAALSKRIPFVKVDTLRYDPYRLNADKLLALCERAYPDAFDGVRQFLRETTSHYPAHQHTQLRCTPAHLKALRPFVEYGRGA